jgi:hypothetical protein
MRAREQKNWLGSRLGDAVEANQHASRPAALTCVEVALEFVDHHRGRGVYRLFALAEFNRTAGRADLLELAPVSCKDFLRCRAYAPLECEESGGAFGVIREVRDRLAGR